MRSFGSTPRTEDSQRLTADAGTALQGSCPPGAIGRCALAATACRLDTAAVVSCRGGYIRMNAKPCLWLLASTALACDNNSAALQSSPAPALQAQPPSTQPTAAGQLASAGRGPVPRVEIAGAAGIAERAAVAGSAGNAMTSASQTADDDTVPAPAMPEQQLSRSARRCQLPPLLGGPTNARPNSTS